MAELVGLLLRVFIEFFIRFRFCLASVGCEVILVLRRDLCVVCGVA